MSKELLASKIVTREEEPRIRNIPGVPTATPWFGGVTERGPVGVATAITSEEEYHRIFGGFSLNAQDMPAAVQGFYQNNPGAKAYITRIVHYTDISNAASKTSAQASVDIDTAAAAPTSGSVLGSIVGPYNLAPGDTLVVDTDAIAPVTATFNATAAARESGNAETFALVNNDTLIVSVDGGAPVTVTFLTAEFVAIGAATAEEVAAVINAKLPGASATVTSGGTKVTITSDRLGTSSGINVSGGTANGVLAFTTGNQAGTGNVANIDSVTVAEVKTIVEAAVAGVTVNNVGGAVQIVRNTTGTGSQVQVQAASTADDEMGFDNAVHSGTSGAATATLRVKGKTDGVYAHDVQPVVAAATSGDASEFNLLVFEDGVLTEQFPNVTMDDAAENYVESIVNDAVSGSDLIAVEDLDVGLGSATADRPANGTYTMTGGNDGLSGLADVDYLGAAAANTGIRSLDTINDVRIVACPGRSTSAVHNGMLSYAEVTRDGTMFAILDPPAGLTAAAMRTYVVSTALLKESSEYGAIYWPRVRVTNPSKAIFGNVSDIVVPPSGHIAGLCGRNDQKEAGVFEAPAGLDWGEMEGVIGIETKEVNDESKRDLLYPDLINPIVALDGLPIHIDGSRTLKSLGPFPTIGERRGVIFVEVSIKQGIYFAKHRKIKAKLYGEISRSVRQFLLTLTRQGAFASDVPSQAFTSDWSNGVGTLNPPSVQFIRQVRGRIGLATAKPAEFIIITISQDQRALEEELALEAA